MYRVWVSRQYICSMSFVNITVIIRVNIARVKLVERGGGGVSFTKLFPT